MKKFDKRKHQENYRRQMSFDTFNNFIIFGILNIFMIKADLKT